MKNKIEMKIKNGLHAVFTMLGYRISKIHREKSPSDRLVNAKIGSFYMMMNENHQLPVYLKYQPYYSQNLPRLAVRVLEKYKNLKMIDVGANIGDTVALVRTRCNFPIACIEGNDEFFGILKRNLQQFKEVSAFKHLLGDKNESVEGKLVTAYTETARIQNTESGEQTKTLSVITLDTFLVTHQEFESAKLLKIDTDGFDMKIIRGGKNYLAKTKPVLFFEYDTVFLADQHDDGLSTLEMLRGMGYKDIMYYDNLGHFILSADLNNKILLRELHNCINPKTRTPFPYYDIAVFHQEDADLAEKFLADEFKFYYKETL